MFEEFAGFAKKKAGADLIVPLATVSSGHGGIGEFRSFGESGLGFREFIQPLLGHGQNHVGGDGAIGIAANRDDLFHEIGGG